MIINLFFFLKKGVYSNVKNYVPWINKNRNFVYSTAPNDVVASKILVIISFYFSIIVFSKQL